jgi:hypothetical protein
MTYCPGLSCCLAYRCHCWRFCCSAEVAPPEGGGGIALGGSALVAMNPSGLMAAIFWACCSGSCCSLRLGADYRRPFWRISAARSREAQKSASVCSLTKCSGVLAESALSIRPRRARHLISAPFKAAFSFASRLLSGSPQSRPLRHLRIGHSQPKRH